MLKAALTEKLNGRRVCTKGIGASYHHERGMPRIPWTSKADRLAIAGYHTRQAVYPTLK